MLKYIKIIGIIKYRRKINEFEKASKTLNANKLATNKYNQKTIEILNQFGDLFYLVQVDPKRGETTKKLKEKLNKYNKPVHVSESVSNEEIGPVLSWNPATGNLQLSQAATQRLLKSLGGRLTNRRDKGITIFFPISELKEFDHID